MTRGRVFRGGAAKVGSAGRQFSAKTNDTNKEETKGRTNKKIKQAVHSDRAAASGHKCAQQTALGGHNCARAGRRPGRAMKRASLTG